MEGQHIPDGLACVVMGQCPLKIRSLLFIPAVREAALHCREQSGGPGRGGSPITASSCWAGPKARLGRGRGALCYRQRA